MLKKECGLKVRNYATKVSDKIHKQVESGTPCLLKDKS